MKTLLRLQELDLKIEAFRARELEIPKQKNKFDVQRKRLNAELEEREQVLKDLQLQQRTAESDIELMQAQINKYDKQLLSIKKNEEYQALLHEIDTLKKHIAQKEERILAAMMEIDEARALLEEERKRIKGELLAIGEECAVIDQELAEAVSHRKALEQQRAPLAAAVESPLLSRYERIRASKKVGEAVVSLRGDYCSGCNMSVLPQLVNEVLAGKIHACNHCGRLLYDTDHMERAGA